MKCPDKRQLDEKLNRICNCNENCDASADCNQNNTCNTYYTYLPGVAGPQGEMGPAGPQGPPGPAGGVLGATDFYALMPPDNAATVAPGADVSFPQDGPSSGTGITRLSSSTFNLAEIGVYIVLFEVSVDEAGQLMLSLNSTELPYTVAGRATGTSQIVGISMVETNTANSVLTVRNPSGNAAALTITPLAGGTAAASAHLMVMRIQ